MRIKFRRRLAKNLTSYSDREYRPFANYAYIPSSPTFSIEVDAVRKSVDRSGRQTSFPLRPTDQSEQSESNK